jgi:hypothetical protein
MILCSFTWLSYSSAELGLEFYDIDLSHFHHGLERALGSGRVEVGDRLREDDGA